MAMKAEVPEVVVETEAEAPTQEAPVPDVAEPEAEPEEQPKEPEQRMEAGGDPEEIDISDLSKEADLEDAVVEAYGQVTKETLEKAGDEVYKLIENYRKPEDIEGRVLKYLDKEGMTEDEKKKVIGQIALGLADLSNGIERGVIKDEQLLDMTREEFLQLLFRLSGDLDLKEVLELNHFRWKRYSEGVNNQ